MAIAYHNSKSFTSVGGSTTTFDVGTGEQRYFLAVSSYSCTALDYNGTNISTLISFTPSITDGNEQKIKIWGLPNPTSGTNTLTPTMSGDGTISMAVYTGVDSGVQPEADIRAFTNNGLINTTASTLASSVTTLTDGAWSVMFTGGGNNNQNFTASQGTLRTSLYFIFGDGTRSIIDSNGAISPAGNSTLESTWASGTGFISNVIVSLKPYQPSPKGTMQII